MKYLVASSFALIFSGLNLFGATLTVGGLVSSGAGTLVLNGTGTSGTVVVNGGTLTLGSGTLTLVKGGVDVSEITSPNSFAYVLQPDLLAKKQADAVKKLAASQRDWVIIDPSFNEKSVFSSGDISAIRQGRPGRKVLAYLSIGEAQNFRSYWNKNWLKKKKLSQSAPSFLVKESPQWKGNYIVKYWQPEWRDIVLSIVDDLMSKGYDGVYLDAVDGFQSFEWVQNTRVEELVNPETSQSYRLDMVELVEDIADRARAINLDASVVPQNAVQLLEYPDYLSTIDAVGVEDLFTKDNTLQPASSTNAVLDLLELATTKPVLLIEYPKKTNLQTYVEQSAKQVGLVWLVTDRSLKTLGNSGN